MFYGIIFFVPIHIAFDVVTKHYCCRLFPCLSEIKVAYTSPDEIKEKSDQVMTGITFFSFLPW